MIAERLGRHKSTISRELIRNTGKEGPYSADTAVGMTASRRKRIIPSKITELVKDKIKEKLELFWSPEQI